METNVKTTDKKAKKKKKPIYTILLVVAILVFCFSAYKLISIFSEYNAASSEYDELSQYGPQVTMSESSQGEELSQDEMLTQNEAWLNSVFGENQINFSELQNINSEVVGWIILKDTAVNYPIPQTDDNQYYVENTFKRQKNASGAIFMDYRNDSSFEDRNTILYGHNMKNGSMFHTLPSYQEQAYFDAHSVGALFTPDGQYEIQLFSAYIVAADDPYTQTQFSSDEEYMKFIDKIRERSLIESDVEVSAEDKIVTLSTCTYEFEDARFVVHGKLVKR